ncbi:MAG: amidase family protein, partial [Acidimicrobiales bacterium]
MKDSFRPDPHPPSAELARLSATDILARLESGDVSSVEVVSGLMARVEALDSSGPAISSVVTLSGSALDEAAACDRERRAGQVRGPLHGLAVLVKDNIDTERLGATAGSFALSGSRPAGDAATVTALKAAGAVVLGKTNLSEWANFRSRPSSSGWSAVGGQTRNPHALNRSPGGSSSGSGAAVASGLAPLAVGTETNGSILCPAAACGIVGVKPTVGLVSRTGIVPIAASQDTAGPMARTVADVALLLEVLAGSTEVPDPEDRATRRRPPGLDSAYRAAAVLSCRGLRVGVVRDGAFSGFHGPTDAAAAVAVEALRAAGAKVVDPVLSPGRASQVDEMVVLFHEMKAGINSYLARRCS